MAFCSISMFLDAEADSKLVAKVVKTFGDWMPVVETFDDFRYVTVSAPLLVAKLSVSTPMRCSSVTNRLQSGVLRSCSCAT